MACLNEVIIEGSAEEVRRVREEVKNGFIPFDFNKIKECPFEESDECSKVWCKQNWGTSREGNVTTYKHILDGRKLVYKIDTKEPIFNLLTILSRKYPDVRVSYEWEYLTNRTYGELTLIGGELVLFVSASMTEETHPYHFFFGTPKTVGTPKKEE